MLKHVFTYICYYIIIVLDVQYVTIDLTGTKAECVKVGDQGF